MMQSTTVDKTIDALQQMFLGYLNIDNGSPFTYDAFLQFWSSNGIDIPRVHLIILQ